MTKSLLRLSVLTSTSFLVFASCWLAEPVIADDESQEESSQFVEVQDSETTGGEGEEKVILRSTLSPELGTSKRAATKPEEGSKSVIFGTVDQSTPSASIVPKILPPSHSGEVGVTSRSADGKSGSPVQMTPSPVGGTSVDFTRSAAPVHREQAPIRIQRPEQAARLEAQRAAKERIGAERTAKESLKIQQKPQEESSPNFIQRSLLEADKDVSHEKKAAPQKPSPEQIKQETKKETEKEIKKEIKKVVSVDPHEQALLEEANKLSTLVDSTVKGYATDPSGESDARTLLTDLESKLIGLKAAKTLDKKNIESIETALNTLKSRFTTTFDAHKKSSEKTAEYNLLLTLLTNAESKVTGFGHGTETDSDVESFLINVQTRLDDFKTKYGDAAADSLKTRYKKAEDDFQAFDASKKTSSPSVVHTGAWSEKPHIEEFIEHIGGAHKADFDKVKGDEKKVYSVMEQLKNLQEEVNKSINSHKTASEFEALRDQYNTILSSAGITLPGKKADGTSVDTDQVLTETRIKGGKVKRKKVQEQFAFRIQEAIDALDNHDSLKEMDKVKKNAHEQLTVTDHDALVSHIALTRVDHSPAHQLKAQTDHEGFKDDFKTGVGLSTALTPEEKVGAAQTSHAGKFDHHSYADKTGLDGKPIYGQVSNIKFYEHVLGELKKSAPKDYRVLEKTLDTILEHGKNSQYNKDTTGRLWGNGEIRASDHYKALEKMHESAKKLVESHTKMRNLGDHVHAAGQALDKFYTNTSKPGVKHADHATFMHSLTELHNQIHHEEYQEHDIHTHLENVEKHLTTLTAHHGADHPVVQHMKTHVEELRKHFDEHKAAVKTHHDTHHT